MSARSLAVHLGATALAAATLATLLLTGVVARGHNDAVALVILAIALVPLVRLYVITAVSSR